MTLITATHPLRRTLFFHSFGADGQIHFTQAPEKAHHFSSFDEAHIVRESREFWAGLEASDFTNILIGITSEADPEYRSRIEADRCTWQFTDKIRSSKPQDSVDDLPLFGGERQTELFKGDAT